MRTLNPNNFGNNLTVEQCPKISVNKLIKEVNYELKSALLQSKLEAMGIRIELCSSKTRFNGRRLWFKCPLCSQRVGVMFYHPIKRLVACRLCIGVDYKDRRYKGMTEQILTMTNVSYNKG